jgi:hypothetical protein
MCSSTMGIRRPNAASITSSRPLSESNPDGWSLHIYLVAVNEFYAPLYNVRTFACTVNRLSALRAARLRR